MLSHSDIKKLHHFIIISYKLTTCQLLILYKYLQTLRNTTYNMRFSSTASSFFLYPDEFVKEGKNVCISVVFISNTRELSTAIDPV